MLKGISGRKLFLKYPEIKSKLWKGHLWNIMAKEIQTKNKPYLRCIIGV
jgi:hypothetical protein